MKIKCITNLVKDIPKEYLEYHQTNYDTDPLLTVGKEYIVTGLEFDQGRLVYFAQLDTGDIYKTAFCLFDVIDDRIPGDWRLRIKVEKGVILATTSFEEWLDDSFVWKYYENGEKELRIVNSKINQYRSL